MSARPLLVAEAVEQNDEHVLGVGVDPLEGVVGQPTTERLAEDREGRPLDVREAVVVVRREQVRPLRSRLT